MSVAQQSRAQTLSRPEVVFLDLGDTLLRAHPSWAGVYSQGLDECGIEVDEESLEQALLEATKAGSWTFEGPFEASAEAAFERIMEFDAAVLRSLGYGELDEQVFRSIEAAFARVSAWHVFPDVQPAVEVLREAGLRLGVISNWLWGGPELIHDLDLARHFETLVISARVGYQKPHARIFQQALERMGVEPAGAIHVGDNYRADVVGARRVGIQPVLIDRRSADLAQLQVQLGETELPIVGDLFDLLEVLGLGRATARRPG
ncbi:HAD family hydrolase [soil metagenome]